MYKFNVFSIADRIRGPLVVGAVVVLVTVDMRNSSRPVPYDMDAIAVVYIGNGSSTGPSVMYQTAVLETLLLGDAAQTRSRTT